jgi:hypothetical protein
MDFVLRYRGPLASGGDPQDKQRIRRVLHPQLEVLCRQEPLLEGALSEKLHAGVIKGRKVEVPEPLGNMLFFAVSLNGYQFVPLVTRPHNLACNLELVFLRRERPGAIVHGGDLDNRLKTLLDALRMPLDDSELRGSPSTSPDERMFCLLEDDSLITHLSIRTHQLLEPPTQTHADFDVDLLMHVNIYPTFPMWGNLGF